MGAAAAFHHPSGVAVYALPDSGYFLYVGDYVNNCIRRIDATGDGDDRGRGRRCRLPGRSGPERGVLWAHGGRGRRDSGNLYIADTSNNRIREAPSAGLVSTVAGTGSTAWRDGPADGGAAFSAPTGIAVATTGGIYVADTNNNAVRLISSGQVSTLAGSGNSGAGYADGSGGDGGTARLNGPTGFAVNPVGDAYVADQEYNRVWEILHA